MGALGEAVDPEVVVSPVVTVIELDTRVFAFVAVRSTLVVLLGKPAYVRTGKLTLIAPAGIFTVSGTVADAGIRLNTATGRPPAGAGSGALIVPVAVVPALTLEGLTVNDDNVGGGGGVPGGFTVRSAETVTPCPETKTVTTVGADTA